jgi:hypothetical protein
MWKKIIYKYVHVLVRFPASSTRVKMYNLDKKWNQLMYYVVDKIN